MVRTGATTTEYTRRLREVNSHSVATPLHLLLHRCYGAWDQAATVRGCPTSNPNHYIVQVERSGATITEVVCGTRAPVQPPEVSRVETVRGQLVQYRSRRDVSPRSPWRATGEFVKHVEATGPCCGVQG